MTVKLHGHAELSQYEILDLFVIQYISESRNIIIDLYKGDNTYALGSIKGIETKDTEFWMSTVRVDLLEALLLAACFAMIVIPVSSFQFLVSHFEVTIESLIHV
ncbi:transmembrane protein, putative [Medicago truncatula]|uniref:Transmembrane protein, putative n=1 Tax=Medicago truncatula TaxID=3880 RepID=A0A072UWY1_MEDTR|nr:transmembrane protein, putative [Medicago truncatula]